MLEPELMVGIKEVVSLITTITVHSVRIDHEVELLAFLVEGVEKLEGVLMVHIVVSCTVSEFEHYRFDRLPRR